MSIKRIALILLAVVVLAGGAFSFWIYRSLHQPVVHTQSGKFIEIARGTAPGAVIRKLTQEGIVKNEWPVLVYLKLTGTGAGFRAGEYDFPSPVTPLQVIAKLQTGQQRLLRLTVVEGWTRWEIAAAMTRIPELKLPDSDSALQLMNDTALIKDIDPTADNLEGYLYPATYEFPRDTTASDLIALMVKRFREEWTPSRASDAKELGLTPRQVVTTASLIETEAKLPEERPVIAAVIYNRLKIGMPLGVDSSVIYATKLAGKWRNDGKVYQSYLDRRSPYNTRLYAGLPPGPIASPGESSLSAALNPQPVDYLYYVREPSRDDGAHNFYTSESDFQRGVNALRDWERQRDLESAPKSSQ
ncbi:MAG TPA: endolytic transglycosylase MltG [Pyrinomonadaceae bacterium]|nr:endolytic transglycosylase MltG [Pyrinomonadaceae bacterium]